MTQVADLQPNPATFRAALGGESVRGIMLLDLEFASMTMRVSNWNIDQVIGGNKYYGAGMLARVSEIGDGTGNSSPPIEYGLGVPFDALDAVSQGNVFSIPDILRDKAEYTGRPAKLSLQVFNENGPVGVPMSLHVGLMYRPRLVVSTETVDLSIYSESITVRKRAPSSGYLTYSDQTARHPTDEGLEYAATAVSEPVDWLNS